MMKAVVAKIIQSAINSRPSTSNPCGPVLAEEIAAQVIEGLGLQYEYGSVEPGEDEPTVLGDSPEQLSGLPGELRRRCVTSWEEL